MLEAEAEHDRDITSSPANKPSAPWAGFDPAAILASTRTLAELHPAWHLEAACAGSALDQWFPRRGEPITELQAICASCPVVDECREVGLSDIHLHGIWGGLSKRQRDAIRRGKSDGDPSIARTEEPT